MRADPDPSRGATSFVVAGCLLRLGFAEHEVGLARRLGIDTLELWDRDRIQAELHSPLYCGAKHDPDCAILNPWKLVHGLRQAAERRGAEVYEHAQVESIGWRGRQGIEDARNLVHYYRLTADNRILMGGGKVRYRIGGGADEPGNSEDRETREDLQRFVTRLFPQLDGVRFSHHWGGPVSCTLDVAPAIGQLGHDGRVFYSLGCVGHGVSLSVVNGAVLRDLVLGVRSPLTELFYVNRGTVLVPPEPLRYLVARGILGGLTLHDRWQERSSSLQVQAAQTPRHRGEASTARLTIEP